MRSAVIAGIGLLAGCDALWRIDTIAPAIDARPIDGSVDHPVYVDPTPFAHYTMDSVGAAPTIPDSVGGHDATCAPSCPALVSGRIDHALDFNSSSTDQRLTIAATGAFVVQGPFSISGWVALDTLNAEACLWAKPFGTVAGDSWQVCVHTNGAVEFSTYGANGLETLTTASGLVIPKDGFHDVVVVFDGTVKRIYWDGAQAIAPEVAQVPLLDTSSVLIGSNFNAALATVSSPTIGALDDVQFFSYALGDAEIATLASGN